jgi:hypothetical protein
MVQILIEDHVSSPEQSALSPFVLALHENTLAGADPERKTKFSHTVSGMFFEPWQVGNDIS